MPHDDDSATPSIEALVAGTIALMTSWANPCLDARIGLEAQRSLLARKVISNLFLLQHHPDISEALRYVMANAHARWVGIARTEPAHAALPADPARRTPNAAITTASLSLRAVAHPHACAAGSPSPLVRPHGRAALRPHRRPAWPGADVADVHGDRDAQPHRRADLGTQAPRLRHFPAAPLTTAP